MSEKGGGKRPWRVVGMVVMLTPAVLVVAFGVYCLWSIIDEARWFASTDRFRKVAPAYGVMYGLERYRKAHGAFPTKLSQMDESDQYDLELVKKGCRSLGHPIRRVRLLTDAKGQTKTREILLLEAKDGRVVFYRNGKVMVGISRSIIGKWPSGERLKVLKR